MKSRTVWFKANPEPTTDLYPHAPVGTATPGAESLTSYFKRLCFLHRLTPSFVIRFFVANGSPPECSGVYKNSRSINGLEKRAGWWSNRLIELTGQNDLSSHTLIALKTTKWRRHLLETKGQKWCVDCLNDQHNVGQIPVELLLWSFQAADYCPDHGNRLRTECPYCEETISPLGPQSLPGICSSCHRPLAGNPTNRDPQLGDLNSAKRTWEIWKVQQIQALIAQLPTIKPRSEKILQESLRRILDQNFQTQTEIARLMAVSKSTVHGWITGKQRPSFVHLLRLLYRVNQDLPTFLFGSSIDAVPGSPIGPEDIPWTRMQGYRVQSNTRADIKRKLLKLLESSRIPSIQYVLESIPISQKYLDTFPDLKDEFLRRAADYTKRCAAVNRARVLNHIRIVMDELYQQRRPLTRKAVQKRIPKPKYWMDPAIEKAFRALKKRYKNGGTSSAKSIRSGQIFDQEGIDS